MATATVTETGTPQTNTTEKGVWVDPFFDIVTIRDLSKDTFHQYAEALYQYRSKGNPFDSA